MYNFQDLSETAVVDATTSAFFLIFIIVNVIKIIIYVTMFVPAVVANNWTE